MSDLPRQQSQHFLITGAGTGIGQAIALRLAQEGAKLSLLARDTARLQATAKAAMDAGASAVHVGPCDIRDRGLVDDAVDECATVMGPLRGVIANAGLGGPNYPGPQDRFDELIQTNLIGTYSCLRAAQRHLDDGPSTRHMVVIASVLSRIGIPGHTGYCASKTALLGLVRALALEVAAERIQVNAVCPGWIDTDMAREGIQGMASAMDLSYDNALAKAMRGVPLGRMGKPRDIAGVVAWLLSPDARGVTGQGIDINGGAWMG
ncbi:MAG: SDR family oxidoreductase [Oligoflexia bacterium]|nr:SDR family oxidoreductase [Oligoflexia bacterium]